MKMKYIKFILLVVCMLILTGCTSGKKVSSSPEEADGGNKGTGSEGGSEYQYSKDLVKRENIDGKMAVYFLRGDYALVDKDGNEEPTGEATLLIAPDGTTMLVDFQDSMINGAYVAEVLEKLGVDKLDYAVLTSPHAEHLGGYSIVMHTVEIGQIITNHHVASNITYKKFMEAAADNNIPVSNVSEGDTFTFGNDVQVEVFNPPKEYEEWKNDEGQRNGSLLLKFVYHQSSFLIGGDLTATMEEQLIAKHGEKLRCDVVKMNNQGSKDSNTKEWISAIDAKIAVGERNLVENDIVVGRYAMRADAALHTAIDGTCLVYTTGDGSYEVQVEKERIGDTYLALEAEEGYFKVQ